MNTTQTQTTSAVIIAAIAGFLAGKGVFGFDAATWTIILGGLGAAGMAAWTAIATRKKSLVTTVNAMPEVKAVITTNTEDGKAMASSIPSPSVVPEGTIQAKELATNGVVK